MSDSSKSRVTSSKTPRGSQYPHRNAGYDGIVQPVQNDVQPTATVEEVNRILELGQLLSSVLTPNERHSLYFDPSQHVSNEISTANYVSSSILDEGLRVTDDVRKLQI